MPPRDGPDRDDVVAVLADPARLRTYFQPIVDTATAQAAGWEALTRFLAPDGRPSPWGPAEWFAVAEGSELGCRLEAAALGQALACLPQLPPDTFLSANVSPRGVVSEPVRAALDRHDDLRRVVVEVTETAAVHDVAHLSSVCAGITAAGGLVAVDDAGSGYAGLALIASLRPQLVKVDRELVRGCDRDPVKLSLLEVLGVWAAGMDAWLLAEGVETVAEYSAVVDLGVPLVQGYLTGRPGPRPVGPPSEVAADLRRQAARVTLLDCVASAMSVWPVRPDDGGPPAAPHVVSEQGWPVALVLPTAGGPASGPPPAPGGARRVPVSLRVRPSETVQEALRRAMARPEPSRFDPVVVTDAQGWTVGVATVEQLVARLLQAPRRP